MKYLAPLYVLALHVSKFSMALSTSVLMIVDVLPAVPAVVLSPSAILYNDKELTTEELGYTDILVNTDHINYIFDDKLDTIIMMKNGSTLYIKETIHEVHNRIKRTTALFMGQ